MIVPEVLLVITVRRTGLGPRRRWQGCLDAHRGTRVLRLDSAYAWTQRGAFRRATSLLDTYRRIILDEGAGA